MSYLITAYAAAAIIFGGFLLHLAQKHTQAVRELKQTERARLPISDGAGSVDPEGGAKAG